MVSIVHVLERNGKKLVNKCYPAFSVSNSKRKFAPFPTLYWLACPETDAMVSNLERQGLIGDLELKINSGRYELERRRFKQQHFRYIHERNRLLYDLSLQHQLDINIEDNCVSWLHNAQRLKGIGGIDVAPLIDAKYDEMHLKCLHAHYAHYLGTKDNIIGEWVHELLMRKK